MTAAEIPTELTGVTTCRILTRGRVSGATHAVTVWFAPLGSEIYVAVRNGLNSDWLKNAQAQPEVEVGRRNRSWPAHVAVVTDPTEARDAVEMFAEKYANYPSIIDTWRAHPPVFVRLSLDGRHLSS